MKYVTVSLSAGAADRHPMHQYVVETDGFRASKLVASTVLEGRHTALFHVDGWPPEPYEDSLAAVDTVIEYAIARQSDETFAVYVREDLRDRDRELTEALGRQGLVTLLPVTYDADGTVTLTLVGPSETIQTALDEAPDATLTIREIGSYHARRIGGRSDLTDRQAEAVAAAVDLGYYDDPRDSSVADVGDAIGCAPGTAAEHLRRAERTVMAGAVDTDP